MIGALAEAVLATEVVDRRVDDCLICEDILLL